MENDYLRDVSRMDFTDVYCCRDVDAAAELLTSKLVEVLDNHAPWIVFQQRKNFRPWITAETVELMGHSYEQLSRSNRWPETGRDVVEV